MEKDRGLLTDKAAERAYFAFIAGGFFGISVAFVVPAIIEFFVR